MKKPLVILQARLGSKRLPQKVLRPLLGRPMLLHTLERLRALKTDCDLLLATTQNPQDDPLVRFAQEHHLAYFRGDEEDVLSRFYQAAYLYKPELIVRITGDCPLVQPKLLDSMLSFFFEHFKQYDYLSNVVERSYPKGLDLELFTFSALKKAHLEAKSLYQREHVTPYFYQHPELFSLYNFKCPLNFSSINLSVDTQDDFDRVKRLIEKHETKCPLFEWEEMLPSLKKLNSHL